MTVSKYVYVGLRRGAKSSPVALWYKLDEEGNLRPFDESICFPKSGKKTKLNGGAWIGDIYPISVDDQGICRIAPDAVRERCDDEEQRAKWKLEEKTTETSVMMDNAAKKETIGKMTLEEVRKEYHKQGFGRDTALLAVIIRYITN